MPAASRQALLYCTGKKSPFSAILSLKYTVHIGFHPQGGAPLPCSGLAEAVLPPAPTFMFTAPPALCMPHNFFLQPADPLCSVRLSILVTKSQNSCSFGACNFADHASFSGTDTLYHRKRPCIKLHFQTVKMVHDFLYISSLCIWPSTASLISRLLKYPATFMSTTFIASFLTLYL